MTAIEVFEKLVISVEKSNKQTQSILVIIEQLSARIKALEEKE